MKKILSHREIVLLSVLLFSLISGCAKRTSEGMCVVDNISGIQAGEITKIKKPVSLTVSGWAVNYRSGSVPREVSIELVSVDDEKISFIGPAVRGTKRPDVVKAYNNAEFIDAGYDGNVNVEKALIGRYSIWINQNDGANKFSCDTKRYVELE